MATECILCKCIIYVYLLKDLLGEGGEHIRIRKTLKHPHSKVLALKRAQAYRSDRSNQILINLFYIL